MYNSKYIFKGFTLVNLLVRDFNLKPFALDAKPLMDEYISLMETQLSDYSFASNFIWLSHASGFYGIINDTFCLFVMSGGDLSMLLPPLGKKEKVADAMVSCFEIMNAVNTQRSSSRIDYVCESFLSAFVDQLEEGTDMFEILQDYLVEKNLVDYVYDANDMIELKGNSYHSKRNEINKFIKAYNDVEIELYDPILHKDAVSALFQKWVSDRMRYMPNESFEVFFDGIALERFALKRLLDNYDKLGILSIVLKIDGKICGFTAGEKLNEQTASIIFEKTDFEKLGAAQFIFREFCKKLKIIFGIEFINVGDDMGFENLKKVKLSYRPKKFVPKYSIYQK